MEDGDREYMFFNERNKKRQHSFVTQELVGIRGSSLIADVRERTLYLLTFYLLPVLKDTAKIEPQCCDFITPR